MNTLNNQETESFVEDQIGIEDIFEASIDHFGRGIDNVSTGLALVTSLEELTTDFLTPAKDQISLESYQQSIVAVLKAGGFSSLINTFTPALEDSAGTSISDKAKALIKRIIEWIKNFIVSLKERFKKTSAVETIAFQNLEKKIEVTETKIKEKVTAIALVAKQEKKETPAPVKEKAALEVSKNIVSNGKVDIVKFDKIARGLFNPGRSGLFRGGYIDYISQLTVHLKKSLISVGIFEECERNVHNLGSSVFDYSEEKQEDETVTVAPVSKETLDKLVATLKDSEEDVKAYVNNINTGYLEVTDLIGKGIKRFENEKQIETVGLPGSDKSISVSEYVALLQKFLSNVSKMRAFYHEAESTYFKRVKVLLRDTDALVEAL